MFKRTKGAVEIADGWFAATPQNTVLDKVNELVNWEPIRNRLAKLYAPVSKGGRPGFDGILLLKLLLLEHWYGLSDGDVIEASADRLSFRRFLDIGVGDKLPDSTVLVKFRNRIQKVELLEEVLEYINYQIQGHGFTLRSGKIIDASLVRARTRPRNNGSEQDTEPQADKTSKNGLAHYGYKMHMATDVKTNVITKIKITKASMHDSKVFEEFIDGDEQIVYADKAYSSKKRRQFLKKYCIGDGLMQKATRSGPLSKSAKKLNKIISKIRSKIERKFGEMKQWHGLERMRYKGILRGELQAFIVAIITNLKFLVKSQMGTFRHCA